MREQDFYAVLGVTATADTQTLRRAYRRAARQHHPDRGGSAEQFHQIQQAWEVLGDQQARVDYDRRHAAAGNSGSADSADSPAPPEEGAGFTYTRHASPRARSRSGGARTREGAPPRSSSADLPVVYEPPLSQPQPLPLAQTSQKVHGEFASRGLFGRGRTARRHQRSIAVLEKNVLGSLNAARLFNDVWLAPVAADRKGQLRAPKGAETAEHVLLCGDALVLVSALEVPAATASWDGRILRAAGKSLPLPDLAAQSRKLRSVLRTRLQAEYGISPALKFEVQHLLLAADGDLFHPVVEAVGSAASASMPLAAGRAIGRIANILAASEQANRVDRRVMAVLRDQLAAPVTG